MQEQQHISFRSVVLAVTLSVILSAANAYLGLFAGMTVSASIPAAVASIGFCALLRRNYNIIEANAVQTAASAGEALAAGVIFTVPALLLSGVWQEVHYFETTAIALVGGMLGVFCAIPLRKAMVEAPELPFPEGVATASVLRAPEMGGKAVKYLLWGAAFGALYKFFQNGVTLFPAALSSSIVLFGLPFRAGITLAPSLLAVGFIVRLNIALLVGAGGIITWWVILPVMAAFLPAPPGVAAGQHAQALWSSHARFVGVGAMFVGGLWALLQQRRILRYAMQAKVRQPRETGDINLRLVYPILLSIGLICAIWFYLLFDSILLAIGGGIFVLLGSFIFSMVAAYLAGVVGSSNNPVSGVAIATIAICSLALHSLGWVGSSGIMAALFIGAVVCCAAAISGDTMQDFKAGQLIGADPWRQQGMQLLGVVAAALVLAPILQLLAAAYGFGPRSAAMPHALPAVQATLMQGVAEGVFYGSLPWGLVLLGAAIAQFIIGLDCWAQRKGLLFRLPVLAVAVGLYLPLELGVAIAFGGCVRALSERRENLPPHPNTQLAAFTGVLACAGIIAGEALTGVALAIPAAISGQASLLTVTPSALWGAPLFGIAALWLWSLAEKQ